MSLVIAMNLIAAAVIVGGWTAAVWAIWSRLDDPCARHATRRARVALPPAASSPQSEPVQVGRTAA